jgi:SPP1 gp7 family putative phage head morphogenesis protein
MATVNEKLLDRFIRHSIYLERFKNSEARRISSFLGTEVYPEVIKKVETAVFNKRTKQLAAAIDRIMQAGMVKAGERTIDALTDLSAYEAEWTANTIRKAVPLDIEMSMPSQEVLKQIVTSKPMDGHKLQTWLNGYSRAARSKMMKQINVGIALGESLPDIGRRMRQVITLKRKQAEYIARTAVSSVVHNAREEVYKRNLDLVPKYQWVSTLDDRTTLDCINLDGQVFPVGDGPTPPGHFNCRSTTIPVVVGWGELGIEAPPPATRASMNGAVPEKTTYADWFKKQTQTVQLKVLGPKRFELYKAGTPLKGFVGSDYSPISLDKLKRVESIGPVIAMSQGQWEKSLTGAQKDAIEDWSVANYTSIKKAELAGKLTPSVNKFYDSIKDAPNFSGTIYRAGYFGTGDLNKARLEVGKSIQFATHSSATSSKKVVEKIADFAYEDPSGPAAYILKIEAKRGIDIHKLCHDPKEFEVLIRRSSQHKITKLTTMSDGLTMIEVEEL